MLLIRVNRQLVKVSIIVMLILSICFNIYSYLWSAKLSTKYEVLCYLSNQFTDSSLVTFVASTLSSDNGTKIIEIFDISKGEVIKKVKPDTSVQNIASNYLNAISGIYGKVKAFPAKGYIIRIPLNPPVYVQTPLLNDYSIDFVDEVFILLPEQGDPYLLVLDEKYRPFFYTFEGDVDILLQQLEFYPMPS